MRTVNNFPRLSTVLCLFIAIFVLSGCEPAINSSALASGVSPDYLPLDLGDVKGIVLIESPKMGSLLHLRGIAGKGRLIFKPSTSDTINKQYENAQCTSLPIRFAAGDFGGSNIGIKEAEVIRLLIYSDEIMEKLIAGDEIVSEHYLVMDSLVMDSLVMDSLVKQSSISEQKRNAHGDIEIVSGLTPDYGFVLNPNEWSWSSLFRQDRESEDCLSFG